MNTEHSARLFLLPSLPPFFFFVASREYFYYVSTIYRGWLRMLTVH